MGSRDEFAYYVSKLVEKITSSKKLKGVTNIYAPGQRESQTTKQNIQASEIEIEENLLKELKKAAAKSL